VAGTAATDIGRLHLAHFHVPRAWLALKAGGCYPSGTRGETQQRDGADYQKSALVPPLSCSRRKETTGSVVDERYLIKPEVCPMLRPRYYRGRQRCIRMLHEECYQLASSLAIAPWSHT
jgi:hypothetical protein